MMVQRISVIWSTGDDYRPDPDPAQNGANSAFQSLSMTVTDSISLSQHVT
jgi:hypothetical protein